MTAQYTEVEWQGTADVTAATNDHVVFTKNYLGTWPNVMTRVNESFSTHLDLQGFTGVPFTASWDTGIYKSGDESGTWSGTVYITGDISIPSGATLDVAAGTQILFVDHDQDLDGRGDFGIAAAGDFNLSGAVGNEILIAGYGASDIDMFDQVSLGSTSTSSWTDVNLRNATTGLSITGSSSINRLYVSTVALDGIRITAGSPMISSTTVDGAGRNGIHVGNASPALSRLMVRNNLNYGINYVTTSGGTLEDSTIRENQSSGIYVSGTGAPALNYNLITYNGGSGVQVVNNSNVSGSYNIIKFNDDAGITLRSGTSQDPSATFNYSNIYGNSVLGTTVADLLDPSAVLTMSYQCCSGTNTSAVYTIPNALEAQMVRVVYSESDNSNNYVQGQILDGATGSVLRSFSTSTTNWFVISPGTTSLRVRVLSSSSSRSGTITITDLLTSEYTSANTYELSAMTKAGTSDAKFNYWTPTIGEVPTKIYQARNGSVDFTGFTGAEYPSGQVTQVGPRP